MSQRKKSPKRTKFLKFLLKVSLSFLLIMFVFTEVDVKTFVKQLSSANPLYILLAIISVIFGQVFGSARMRYYSDTLDMHFSQLYSLSFYFIGTLFNIVLPGGIGGDGYKAYYFQKKFRYPWHKTIFVVLRGRASGLLVLCVLVCILGAFYSNRVNFEYAHELFLLGLIAVFPCYSYLAKKLLKEPVKVQIKALKYSLIVQTFYLFAIIFILYSIGNFQNILGYIVVFLISNIIAVIPISFGGVGLREFTFIKCSAIMNLQMDIGVAASLLFYLIYTFVSLIGFIPYLYLDKLDRREMIYLKKLGKLKKKEEKDAESKDNNSTGNT
jgi:hypothetical protein